MRVSTVNASGVTNNNFYKKPPKSKGAGIPSFKADVRIPSGCYFTPETMPEEQAKPLFTALVNALNNYKKIGSDNILIYLKPVTNNASWKHKIKSNIEIAAMYKDPEKAVEEVLENIQKHPQIAEKANGWRHSPEQKEAAIDGLETKNPFVLRKYKNFIINRKAVEIGENEKTVTPQKLDEVLSDIIESMSYTALATDEDVPNFFVWDRNKHFVTDTDVDDERYDIVTQNYPVWEKELWEKMGVDYITQLTDSDSVLPY